ncbi:hypothetical protein ACIA5D_03235 [Actinoplanes sp. NPDC051513]|uniref:hypothetical protein n=1 Tax=Actinoplanes sp. NPDC051513 TaxID=3363908 RepID=UPI00378B04E3
MRIPTFSRQTETETPDAERPTPSGTAAATDTRTTPVRTRRDERDEPKTAELPTAPARADRTMPPPPPPSTVSRPVFPKDETDTQTTPPVAGPKPRASLLATLGLILGVAAVLLVLSGPLLGWGIGVAGLALILSLSGIHATGKRHVAGKTDAMIGMVLALAAIVLGVLALTGSLTWLGTDTNSVPSLRDWLDTHTVNHF